MAPLPYLASVKFKYVLGVTRYAIKSDFIALIGERIPGNKR